MEGSRKRFAFLSSFASFMIIFKNKFTILKLKLESLNFHFWIFIYLYLNIIKFIIYLISEYIEWIFMFYILPISFSGIENIFKSPLEFNLSFFHLQISIFKFSNNLWFLNTILFYFLFIIKLPNVYIFIYLQKYINKNIF